MTTGMGRGSQRGQGHATSQGTSFSCASVGHGPPILSSVCALAELARHVRVVVDRRLSGLCNCLMNGDGSLISFRRSINYLDLGSMR
jgi:hypothetical protein